MCASTCMLPSSACPLVAHASAAPNRSMLVFARGVASPPTLLTPLPPPPAMPLTCTIRYAKMELRQQQYTRHWKTDLTNATCASPGCERVVMSRGATKAACARLRCPHHATHATHARCQRDCLLESLPAS